MANETRVITSEDVDEMNKEFHRCRVDCSCECGRVYIAKTWVVIKQHGPYFHMPCTCLKD